MLINRIGKGNFRRRAFRKPVSRRRRGQITVLLVVAVLALILSQQLGLWLIPPGPDQQRYHNKTFKVLKIVDGDTLDIDIFDPSGKKPYTRVRLWGVDTPETRHPTMAVMYFGPEASAFTKNLTLSQMVTVKLEPFKDTRGKYGRLLAYIYLPDGTMLNEQLIIQGLGYADERFDHILKDRFQQLQKQAQRQKKGLWHNAQPQQWPQWYRARHDPEYKPKKKNNKIP